MIYITRPVVETHKPVVKVQNKSMEDNNNYKGTANPLPIKHDNQEEKNNQYSKESLVKAIKDTNRMLFEDNDHFEFRIHEGTNRLMIKLVDNETNEVIKEIPPEKILDLAASIWELVGILVDERG